MTDPIHRQTNVSVVDKLMREDPQWEELLTETAAKLNEGFYSQWLVDVVMQKYQGTWSVYEAYPFSQLFGALRTGAVLLAQVELGVEPVKGKRAEIHNHASLAQLEPPFRFEYIHQPRKEGEDDGLLYWDEPLRFSQELDDGRLVAEVCQAGQAPLEVGYAEGSRVLWHLGRERFVARWPYGHTTIHILYKQVRDLWMPDISGKRGDPLAGWEPPVVG